jgi:hypothetical protein
MIDQELTLTCTDNDYKVPAHVLAFKDKFYIDVAINTVRVRLSYNKVTSAYAGSLGGYEFVIKEKDIPEQRQQYRR